MPAFTLPWWSVVALLAGQCRSSMDYFITLPCNLGFWPPSTWRMSPIQVLLCWCGSVHIHACQGYMNFVDNYFINCITLLCNLGSLPLLLCWCSTPPSGKCCRWLQSFKKMVKSPSTLLPDEEDWIEDYLNLAVDHFITVLCYLGLWLLFVEQFIVGNTLMVSWCCTPLFGRCCRRLLCLMKMVKLPSTFMPDDEDCIVATHGEASFQYSCDCGGTVGIGNIGQLSVGVPHRLCCYEGSVADLLKPACILYFIL